MRELEWRVAKQRRVRKYILPEDVMIYQPGSRKRTQNGLDKLGLSMMDNVIAIDLQWNHPSKKVGSLQVASSTFCLFVRGVKYWDHGMPESLAYLFKDPAVITLGFDFGQMDQEKLYDSFGWRMEDFSNFIDLQELAGKCGYPSDISLSSLAEKVLGIRSHVDPELWDVDWEAERLSQEAAFHGSMSVFAIGQIYRQLRHWHALPKRCGTCRQELGIFQEQRMQCLEEKCDHTFLGTEEHRRHCLHYGHPYQSQLCPACYRVKPLENQSKLDPETTVEEMEIGMEERLGQEVTHEIRNNYRHNLMSKYQQTLISSDIQLIDNLYGDISRSSSP